MYIHIILKYTVYNYAITPIQTMLMFQRWCFVTGMVKNGFYFNSWPKTVKSHLGSDVLYFTVLYFIALHPKSYNFAISQIQMYLLHYTATDALVIGVMLVERDSGGAESGMFPFYLLRCLHLILYTPLWINVVGDQSEMTHSP